MLYGPSLSKLQRDGACDKPEAAFPHLPDKRLAEIKKLVFLKVLVLVGILRVEIICRNPIFERTKKSATKHSIKVDAVTFAYNSSLRPDSPNDELLQHLICRV